MISTDAPLRRADRRVTHPGQPIIPDDLDALPDPREPRPPPARAVECVQQVPVEQAGVEREREERVEAEVGGTVESGASGALERAGGKGEREKSARRGETHRRVGRNVLAAHLRIDPAAQALKEGVRLGPGVWDADLLRGISARSTSTPPRRTPSRRTIAAKYSHLCPRVRPSAAARPATKSRRGVGITLTPRRRRL